MVQQATYARQGRDDGVGDMILAGEDDSKPPPEPPLPPPPKPRPDPGRSYMINDSDHRATKIDKTRLDEG